MYLLVLTHVTKGAVEVCTHELRHRCICYSCRSVQVLQYISTNNRAALETSFGANDLWFELLPCDIAWGGGEVGA